MRTKILLFFVLITPTIASAEGGVDCNSSCDTDQTMVSYVDGATITCQCVQGSTMVETVSNPDIPVDLVVTDPHEPNTE